MRYILKTSTGKVHEIFWISSVNHADGSSHFIGETECGLDVDEWTHHDEITTNPVTCKRCLAILEKHGRVSHDKN